MTTVENLLPGDLVGGPGGGYALFLGASPHPKYPGLQLVIWNLDDGTWTFDALSAKQDVGQRVEQGPMARLDRLKVWFQ